MPVQYVPRSPSQPLVDEPDTQDLDEMHYVERDSSANAHAARRGARNADLTGDGEGFAGNTYTTPVVGMRLRRGRICPSPVQAQPGARTPPARLGALDPVREEEDSSTHLGGGVGAELGDRHEGAEVGAQPLPSPGDGDPIATTRTAPRLSPGGGVGDGTANGHEDAEAGAQMGAQGPGSAFGRRRRGACNHGAQGCRRRPWRADWGSRVHLE